MPPVGRREFVARLTGTAVWPLATAALLSSLLTSGAEARTWICWEYPDPICTIIKPARPTMRPGWAVISHRKVPRCPRGFWAVCGECPC